MRRVFKDEQKLQEMLGLLRAKPPPSPSVLARKYHCDHTTIIYYRRKINGKIPKRRAPKYIPPPLPPLPPITHLYDTYIFKDKINQGKVNYQEYLGIYERKRTGNLQKAL